MCRFEMFYMLVIFNVKGKAEQFSKFEDVESKNNLEQTYRYINGVRLLI